MIFRPLPGLSVYPLAFASVLALGAATAQAAVLNNGLGDFSVGSTGFVIEVSDRGRILGTGVRRVLSSSTILFTPDPVDSFVALTDDFGRSTLDDFAVDVTTLSVSDTGYVTSFDINNLSFLLDQQLVDWRSAKGELVGLALVQEFYITNLTEVTSSFDLVRFFDQDTDMELFGLSQDDSGGRIGFGFVNNLDVADVLFEIDGSGSSIFNFVGISSSVSANSSSGNENFEIDSGSGLVTRILGGADLDNTVEGDLAEDGLIDGFYQVGLALQDFISIEPGASVLYTTTTLFGTVEPPVPGSSDDLPLLPTFIGPDGFVFELDARLLANDQRVWIDPIIATGYTYKITGAEFASVTAPSLAVVNDADGYMVTVGGSTFSLLAGETYTFGDGVNEFTIADIATGLALDPADPAAFATGISVRDIVAQTIVITQTPITRDVPDVAPVPLPAGGVLLGAGLLGLLAMRRRRV